MGLCAILSGTPLAVFGTVYDSDHPLGSGMYVDVPNFNRLLATSLVPIESLDHLELQPEQLSSVAAVDVDVSLVHVMLALTQKLEAGKTGSGDLDGDECLHLCLRIDGGDQSDRRVEGRLVESVV